MEDTELEFTIKVKMRQRWVPPFLGMLSQMEYMGSVGQSGNVTIYSDGDCDFRPKFEWDYELPPPADPKDPRDRARDAYFDAG